MAEGATSSSPVPTGCWTCKVRHKRCEGPPPVCNACTSLQVTCYFDATKPNWMDGGRKQVEMTRALKTQIKENTHHRRVKRAIAATSSPNSGISNEMGGAWHVFSQAPVTNMDRSLGVNLPSNSSETPDTEAASAASSCPLIAADGGNKCTPSSIAGLEIKEMGRAESNLMLFYLESLFPFLYPFYRPCVLQGGRAWILDLMLKSPVIRQAMLCQSSYYLTLAQGTSDSDAAFEMVLAQTRDAFDMLRQTTSIIYTEGIAGHIHGAVRTFASILQLQRFEIALSSFGNCQAHLSACVAIFRQLLDVGLASAGGFACPSSCFDTVLRHLGPSSWTLSGKSVQVSSSEQDAFRFSSALLILDDIIASIARQEKPQLYELHASLLASEDSIDLGSVVGCKNWVILQIGEIAALDFWKQQSKRVGNLDVMELVQRAMPIKASILECLRQTPSRPISPGHANPLLNILSSNSDGQNTAASSSLVTRIWAHAAILYLSVVVSGWQPANNEVRIHVQHILDQLCHLTPTTARAICWPLYVAGSLAEPGQEAQFRGLIHDLQPKSLFGTLYRALDVMEKVWQHRSPTLNADLDLAACLRYRDELILLV